MMQTVTTPPNRLRHPLVIVQVILVGLLVVSLTLAALFDREKAGAPIVAATATRSEATATPTATVAETAIPATRALESTSTAPVPTASASPTATPPREPIAHSGIGDSVFYPQKWVGPAVVRISYDGPGPLTVWTQNDEAEREDMLVNVVGPYQGSCVIDLFGSQRILRFEVRTAGAWTIEVLPLSSAMHLTIPGAIQGAGDDVVVLDGPFPPDLLIVDAPLVTGTFSVLSYGSQRDGVIGASGPYSGTVSIPSETTVLAVKALGPWRLEITTR